MSYDIIVRFPTEALAKQFAGQMSDGFGEGFCDFSFWCPKDDPAYVKSGQPVYEGDRRVYFVNDIFEL